KPTTIAALDSGSASTKRTGLPSACPLQWASSCAAQASEGEAAACVTTAAPSSALQAAPADKMPAAAIPPAPACRKRPRENLLFPPMFIPPKLGHPGAPHLRLRG